MLEHCTLMYIQTRSFLVPFRFPRLPEVMFVCVGTSGRGFVVS